MTDENEDKKPRGRPKKPETVTVIVMANNIWWDGERKEKRDRFQMARAEAEAICAGDREAERDERLLIIE